MGDDSDENESESDGGSVDDAEVAQKTAMIQRRGTRPSITGEKFVAKAGWAPPVHSKMPSQADQIREAISGSFLFSSLTHHQLCQVVDAFYGPIAVKPGVEVIQQGSLVDCGEPALFILESGRLDVYRRNGTEQASRVFTYDKVGQSFGELALLYNCPRAATVVASEPSVLWSIDRDTFNHLVKEGYRIVRERHQRLVESVDLLKGLTESDRLRLVDVIKLKTYSRGEQVLREGDVGDAFFMVEQGRAVAKKAGNVVREFGPHEYFGELALLKKGGKRAVDVFADSSPTVLAVLDADCFGRLLGFRNAALLARAKEYGLGDPSEPQPIVSPSEEMTNGSRPRTVSDSFFDRLLGPFCICSTMQHAPKEGAL
eukprot:TRINITY_DN75669_c0_g1_i1.p1 TRINITY_DN75669_c0_g1~~TRINITY_DN75669_c0_g1_i1.p1  ORF type:complete len:371 (-),score=54.89 TRINITY_DN75669_c0_g1_i1:129-1241(-)